MWISLRPYWQWRVRSKQSIMPLPIHTSHSDFVLTVLLLLWYYHKQYNIECIHMISM